MSGFTVSNGKIYDPNGQEFVAAGINVMGFDIGSSPSAEKLQSEFPGINFLRLAIYNYDSPDSLSAYVNDLTSHGIVVELENHASSDGQNRGGSTGTIFTGQTLQNEQDWYSQVAAAFKNNPMVWFGTNNEPSDIDASGNHNPGALSDWQKTTYDSVRNAGNTNPIMLEASSWGPGGTNVDFKASDYSDMHNVIWDAHYYGWLTKGANDQESANSTLSAIVSDTHAITGADGIMPVIIGEFGNSTDGQSIDANGTQTVQAVIDSGLGSAAWAYGSGGPGDGLTSGDSLSDYGKQVESGIAAKAASAPSLPPPTTTPPTTTPPPATTPSAPASTNNTEVQAGSTNAIIDASGNKWTIANGTVQENGQAAGYSANVKEIAYVDGTVWQENTTGGWWGWSNGGWNTGNGTTTSPLPAGATPPASGGDTPPSTTPPATTPPATGDTIGSGSDTIVLTMSEDADGPAGAAGADAQFTLNVDGQQIGGLQTVTASHSAGKTQTFTFQGNYAPGQHAIAVTFANNSMTQGDKASFNDGGDRNLYVNSVSYNGASVSSAVTGVYTSPPDPSAQAIYKVTDATAIPANAPSTPSTSPAPVSVGTGPDTLTLNMMEDPFQGDAQFTVAVDGKQVGGTLTTTAVNWQGQSQEFDVHGTFGAGAHQVAVSFLNDAIGQTIGGNALDSQDRNLYVNSITLNGGAPATIANGPYEFGGNGSHTFSVTAGSGDSGSTPTPPVTGTTPSANDTIVKAGSTNAITDAAGHKWTISNGTVQQDGMAAGHSANVNELAYVDGTVWQENAAGGWWGWSNSGWNTGNGTTTSPLPAGATPPASGGGGSHTTPDTTTLSVAGSTKVVTVPSTVSGDTFSLTASGAVNAKLGSTVSYLKFVGDSGANVTGGSAASVITATAGTNSFKAGTNFMDVTGGSGADAYTFGAKSTFLGIENFSAAQGDTLNVASSLKQGMHTITDNHNTVLAFGNGSAIQLHGVTAAPTIHWTT
jgi:hypothetical protein